MAPSALASSQLLHCAAEGKPACQQPPVQLPLPLRGFLTHQWWRPRCLTLVLAASAPQPLSPSASLSCDHQIEQLRYQYTRAGKCCAEHQLCVVLGGLSVILSCMPTLECTHLETQTACTRSIGKIIQLLHGSTLNAWNGANHLREDHALLLCLPTCTAEA